MASTVITAVLALCISSNLKAQDNITSDTLIYRQLKDYGIHFSDDNSVSLLYSGQEKFDDMFEAIRQAKHSVIFQFSQ